MNFKKFLTVSILSLSIIFSLGACSNSNTTPDRVGNSSVDEKTENLKDDIKREAGDMKDDFDNSMNNMKDDINNSMNNMEGTSSADNQNK